MNNKIDYEELSPYVFVTKLAGFEHTEYIQPHATKAPINDTDIPMVQGKNIRNGEFVEQYDWYIKKEISDSLPRSILNKKCILIPYVGSNLGEVGIFHNKYVCHLASNIAKVELKSNKYSLEYVKYYMQSPIGQSYLFQGKQGSSQPNITMDSIRKTKIIKRSISDQKKIVKILSLIDDQIKKNNDMVQKLQVLGMTIYSKNIIGSTFNKMSLKSSITTGKEDANHANSNGEYKFFTCADEPLLCDDFKFVGKSVLVAGNGNFNVKYYDGKFNAYQRTYIIKNDLIIGNLYYTLLFNAELFRKKSNGSIIKFITIEMLNNIDIPCFSEKINHVLNKTLFKINKINENSYQLKQLKNKLLPLLINQQLI